MTGANELYAALWALLILMKWMNYEYALHQGARSVLASVSCSYQRSEAKTLIYYCGPAAVCLATLAELSTPSDRGSHIVLVLIILYAFWNVCVFVRVLGTHTPSDPMSVLVASFVRVIIPITMMTALLAYQNRFYGQNLVIQFLNWVLLLAGVCILMFSTRQTVKAYLRILRE